MGYEIKRIDNEGLADYAFQINGALALKNYTATVEGSRLRIAHTQNAALSILECEVSEVEIDGHVYDNAEDAQRALQSIVYADLPILVLTREEKQKILDFERTKANADGTNVSEHKEGWKKALELDKVGIGASNQTIESGQIRELDVQGRLDIKNLEEKEEDDITYSKKLVINEDGTLAQKKDKKPINVTFPSTINVKHSYPEALVKQESWTEEILEKVKKLETYDYEKFPISSANVTTGTFNNVEPTSARLVEDNRVIIEVKGALAREDTLEIKSWFEINNLDQNRDWVLKFKNFRKATLYNSVTLGLKYDNRAIISHRGESIGWTIGGYQTDRLGEYTFYFIKMAETITTVVVGENSPVAGMAVSSYVKENKAIKLFGKVSNGEKLQVSNLEIKYL
ncbi:hypothetical protein ACQ1PR_00485 [Ornithobacterium rhinotracheale]|uniref:hypothetical protein n=1 Tax=Ornithobacterium rhinotracheale TaxID=28251 RepID=UPI0040372462